MTHEIRIQYPRAIYHVNSRHFLGRSRSRRILESHGHPLSAIAGKSLRRARKTPAIQKMQLSMASVQSNMGLMLASSARSPQS